MKSANKELQSLNDEDKALLENLYIQYSSEVKNLLKKIVGSQLYLDAFQEVFFKIGKNLTKIKDKTDEKAKFYILTIARNHAYDLLKKMNIERHILCQNEINIESFMDKLAIEKDIRQEEIELNIDLVNHLLKYLSENSSNIIKQKYIEGISEEIIGALSGVKAASIKKRLYRAKKELKNVYNTEQNIVYIQPDYELSFAAAEGEAPLNDESAESESTKDDDLSSFESEDGVEDKELEKVDDGKKGPEDEAENTVEQIHPTKTIEKDFSAKPILVALIDTITDNSHPLLKEYMTDGWNFISGGIPHYDGDQPGAAAHGTHMAGIIAQKAGEYGSKVEIMPLNVFHNGTAYTSSVLRAIAYAEVKGTDVINFSLGCEKESPALYETISESKALFVCAAGNNGADMAERPTYPAAYRLENIVSVGSINNDGEYSHFSNYNENYVDIAAVGRDVICVYPEGEIGPASGTSIAAAQVTAAAAVAAYFENSKKQVEINQQIKESTKEPDLQEEEPLPEATEEEDSGANEDVQPDEDGLSEINEEAEKEEIENNTEEKSEEESVSQEEVTEKTVVLSETITSENLFLELIDPISASYIKAMLFESADDLEGLDGKVAGRRQLNLSNTLMGTSGSRLTSDTYQNSQSSGYSPLSDDPYAGLQGKKIVQITTGFGHTLVLLNDGTAWSWGANYAGQLGNGITIASNLPVQVKGLTNIKEISTSGDHCLALLTNGTVWAWGRNIRGELGDGTTTDRYIPVQVKGLTNVSQIRAGGNHNLAVRADGTCWAWGYNNYGQIGDGTTTNRTSPVRITSLTNVELLAAGSSHSLVRRSDGTLWSWGYNYYGQLGNGSTAQSNRPVQVLSLSRSIGLSVHGNHSLAIRPDGRVAAWGRNDYGQLGDGTNSHRKERVQVAVLEEVTEIDSGSTFSVALTTDGRIWAWGDNTYGQLGDGTKMSQRIPRSVPNFNNVEHISAGSGYSLALRSDGSIWAWGHNTYGQLGDGTTYQRRTPTACYINSLLDPDPVGLKFEKTEYSISTRRAANVQIKATAHIVNSLGLPVGEGEILYSLIDASPGISINAFTGEITVSAGAKAGSFQIRAEYGDWHVDATLIVANPQYLAEVQGGANHSLALWADGSIWSWGQNNHGQLGDGTSLNRNAPQQLGSSVEWEGIAAGGNHSLALTAGGEVWAWGNNSNGQLGSGSTVDVSDPIPISGLTNIKAINAGANYSLALRSDGSVWSWGQNNNGQLGDGTKVDRNLPVNIQSLSEIAAIAAGNEFSVALGHDGYLRAWGYNGYGQLGNGSTTSRTTAAVVSGIDNIVAIATGANHCLALKSDGTVWAWGYNGNGQLGDGTLINRTTPVKIASLSNIVAITAGENHSLALRSDGTVWAWGNNAEGQLGDGTTIQQTVPTHIETLEDCKGIGTGSNYSWAVKANGTVWSWGDNSHGQLGDGTDTDSSQPVSCLLNQQLATIIKQIKFDEGRYSLILLGEEATLQVKARALNYLGEQIENVEITYSLDDVYDGISMDSATGTVVIAPSMEAGEYGLSALCGEMSISAVLHISIGLKEIKFEEDGYKAVLDGEEITLNAAAKVYNYQDQVVESAEITYGLGDVYSGISIDSATGKITVAADAVAGKYIVTAVYEELSAQVFLIVGPKGANTSIEVAGNRLYHLTLSGQQIQNIREIIFTLQYDPQIVILDDLAAGTSTPDTAIGLIPLTDLEILAVEENKILFRLNKNLAPGFTYSGAVTVAKFKAIATGEAEITAVMGPAAGGAGGRGPASNAISGTLDADLREAAGNGKSQISHH